jgi:hypothetical protein
VFTLTSVPRRGSPVVTAPAHLQYRLAGRPKGSNSMNALTFPRVGDELDNVERLLTGVKN